MILHKNEKLHSPYPYKISDESTVSIYAQVCQIIVSNYGQIKE